MTKTVQVLNDAKFEINKLRRQNEIMSARLQMFDSMMTVLNTAPFYSSQGMSPDVVYDIEKTIELESARKQD